MLVIEKYYSLSHICAYCQHFKFFSMSGRSFRSENLHLTSHQHLGTYRYVQGGLRTSQLREDQGSYRQNRSGPTRLHVPHRSEINKSNSKITFCEYGSRWDIWHNIHKYTVYIEVKRRERQNSEKKGGGGGGDVSLEWAEEPVLGERGEGVGVRCLYWGSAFRMAFTSSATAVSANSNCSWGGGGGEKKGGRTF